MINCHHTGIKKDLKSLRLIPLLRWQKIDMEKEHDAGLKQSRQSSSVENLGKCEFQLIPRDRLQKKAVFNS